MTDGYVSEIDYTHRYCSEIAPGMLRLACAARGMALPDNRPLRYLELGYGQGVSVNLHAAACPGEYWGTDVNPAHAANASALAAVSGSGARLFDESFEAFLARKDLPAFDMIALHGTWSWISAENRARVIGIVRQCLAPGGVFYVSYNCWPGWATEMPLRHLLTQHAQRVDPGKGLADRIDASLAFAESMIDAGAAYFEAHPGLKGWLRDMQGRSRRYLAHEYFNRDWHPMPFSEIAGLLSEAGLSFVGSASMAEPLDPPGLSPQSRKLLGSITDPLMRETTLDYLVNRRFRRDLFTREAASPPRDDLFDRIGAIEFTLLQHPDYVVAEGMPDPAALRALVAALAEQDYAPRTLEVLAQHPKCAAIPREHLAALALLLTGAGSLHPVQAPDAREAASPHCKALNRHVLERSLENGDIGALASPVTGAGVFVARQEMLFLLARARGAKDEDEWARLAWESLGEGDPATLRANARAFARIRLPILIALEVA